MSQSTLNQSTLADRIRDAWANNRRNGAEKSALMVFAVLQWFLLLASPMAAGAFYLSSAGGFAHALHGLLKAGYLASICVVVFFLVTAAYELVFLRWSPNKVGATSSSDPLKTSRYAPADVENPGIPVEGSQAGERAWFLYRKDWTISFHLFGVVLGYAMTYLVAFHFSPYGHIAAFLRLLLFLPLATHATVEFFGENPEPEKASSWTTPHWRIFTFLYFVVMFVVYRGELAAFCGL